MLTRLSSDALTQRQFLVCLTQTTALKLRPEDIGNGENREEDDPTQDPFPGDCHDYEWQGNDHVGLDLSAKSLELLLGGNVVRPARFVQAGCDRIPPAAL